MKRGKRAISSSRLHRRARPMPIASSPATRVPTRSCPARNSCGLRSPWLEPLSPAASDDFGSAASLPADLHLDLGELRRLALDIDDPPRPVRRLEQEVPVAERDELAPRLRHRDLVL